MIQTHNLARLRVKKHATVTAIIAIAKQNAQKIAVVN